MIKIFAYDSEWAACVQQTSIIERQKAEPIKTKYTSNVS